MVLDRKAVLQPTTATTDFITIIIDKIYKGDT